MFRLITPVVTVACLSFATASWAGVPLKGVGVSLGKTPGGGVATRTTGKDGSVDFGVLSALPKGVHYTITFDHVPQDAAVTIKGGEGGPITRTVVGDSATNRDARKPIVLISDSKTPIRVFVETSGSTVNSENGGGGGQAVSASPRSGKQK